MLGPSEDTLPEMTRALATSLKSLPVEIYYGKQRLSRAIVSGNRIEITEVGPELFRSSMGMRDDSNPTVAERTISVQALIEAKDNRASADEQDHKHLANWFADLVFAFFLEEGQARGELVDDWRATGGFIEQPDDELPVGAKYVLAFSLGRSVKRFGTLIEAAAGLVSSGSTTITAIDGTTQVVCEG